jgi:hypothetical protein
VAPEAEENIYRFLSYQNKNEYLYYDKKSLKVGQINPENAKCQW